MLPIIEMPSAGLKRPCPGLKAWVSAGASFLPFSGLLLARAYCPGLWKVGQALVYVNEWLDPGYWPIIRSLLSTAGTLGNLTSDAHLTAIAMEHGAKVYSADYDFQRFQGIQHVNPLD
jgi:hypothetical protein